MRVWRLAGTLLSMGLAVMVSATKGQEMEPEGNIDHFEIGRNFVTDFGPPFSHYSIFTLRKVDNGTLVRMIYLTPPGGCLARKKLGQAEMKTVTLDKPIRSLLVMDACAIPEDVLRRAAEPCKGCVALSSTETNLRVECAGKARLIHWGLGLFAPRYIDESLKKAELTQWVQDLTNSLDDQLETARAEKVNPNDGVGRELREGKFDGLFGPEDKVSEVFESVVNPKKLDCKRRRK